MHNVVVVMPIRGRQAQSIECMNRLIKTASYPATYIAVGGIDDRDTVSAVAKANAPACMPMYYNDAKATYWQALKIATIGLPDDALIVNVANDLLPAVHWLRNAISSYDNFGSDYVIGFNGDGYKHEHSCHFMISMKHINEFGGWPIWYHHNFGDTEIIMRATHQRRYLKDVFAILFHNHPIVAGAPNDDVYTEGSSTFEFDRQLFEKRKAAQWSLPS